MNLVVQVGPNRWTLEDLPEGTTVAEALEAARANFGANIPDGANTQVNGGNVADDEPVSDGDVVSATTPTGSKG